MFKTLGKVAGGVGALLVLTSVFTLFFVSGSLVAFWVKLGLGVALLALWAVTNGEKVAGFTRAAFFYSTSAAMTVALVVLLVAVNFVAARRAPSWDLTQQRVNSLSPQTLEALRALPAPVTAYAFIDNGVPEAVEGLFKRYQAVSERFTYQFKDPRRSPDLVQKYGLRAGQLVAFITTGIGPDERAQPLNLERLGNPLLGEQELTNGLVKLASVGAQRLYFLAGHGEWPLTPLANTDEAQRASLQVRRVLEDEGYAPATLNLVGQDGVPADASAVVVAGARSRLSDPELDTLARYLRQGGRLLFFTEPGAETGLEPLLESYGLQLEGGMVADAKVNPEQPYLVVTPFFGKHEITRPLADAQLNVAFATTRAFTLLRAGALPGVTTTPLVITSQYAWIETSMSPTPSYDDGERTGQLVLAAAATRPTAQEPGKRSDEARLAAFGDSELLVGAFGLEPNRNLVLNTFAWATQQPRKITIRPPDRDLSTVELTPQLIATVRLVAMDLLPTLLIAVGLTIWVTRRAR